MAKGFHRASAPKSPQAKSISSRMGGSVRPTVQIPHGGGFRGHFPGGGNMGHVGHIPSISAGSFDPVSSTRPNQWMNTDMGGNRVNRNAIVETKPSGWIDQTPGDRGIAKNPINQKLDIKNDQWQEISGLQEPNVIRQFEGVNFMNSFSIKDSQAMRATNFSTAQYPALAVRTGGNVLANSPFGLPVRGIGIYNNEIHVVAGGTWSKYSTNGSWTQLKTGLTDNLTSFIVFQGNYSGPNLILAPFGSTPYRYDGTTVTAIGTPTITSFLCTHDNRVYYACNQTVYFSALRKADDWTTVNDSGSIVVETPNGGGVTGLVPGAQRLVVFFLRAMYELYGDNPSNYQLKLVSDNLGSPSSSTAQVIDGWMYFLGNDSIYRYAGGYIPDSTFALPVKNVVESINRSSAGNSVSWYKDRKYYLAIPTGTNTTPDTILEYDIEFNMWNVHSYPNNPTCQGARLNGNIYVGFSDGSVEVLDFQSQTDGTNAVSFEWVSKPFSFTSLASRSRWFRMWLVADVPLGATMDVYVSGTDDEEDWQIVQSITADQDFIAQQIIIPSNLINSSNVIRVRLVGSGPCVVYEITRQERTFPMGNL